MSIPEGNETFGSNLWFYVAAFQRENGPIGFRSMVVVADDEAQAYDAGFFRAVVLSGHRDTFRNDYVVQVGTIKMIHPEVQKKLAGFLAKIDQEHLEELSIHSADPAS